MNIDDYKKLKATQLVEQKKDRDEAIKRIPSQQLRGRKLIFPELYELWDRQVCESAEGMYYGETIEDALVIMEALNKGLNTNKIKKMIHTLDCSESGFSITRNIVTYFSKRGPEFFRDTYDEKIDTATTKTLNKIENRNKKLEQLHTRKI